MLSLIAAVSENHVIGKNNQLVWHLPADMRFFKNTTMGHALIMGRKTFESFGKPLAGRRSIVITRQKNWQYQGVEIVHSLEEAIKAAPHDEEVFIVGGAEIYRLALPLCKKIYLTMVHHQFDGDAFFPPVDFSQWNLISEEKHPANEKHAYAFSIRVYERK